VYYLRNGDRITGQTLAQRPRAFTVQTPFGRLVVPRIRVARVVRADGSEEVLHAADPLGPPTPREAGPAATPPPATATGRLALAITGKTFWQAWNPKETERDTTLRLELRLDEETMVVYGDGQLDEGQISGAMVNAFSFAEGLTVSPAPGVRVHPAEVRPGRIVLRLDVPGAVATRRLRVAYQGNTGTLTEPAWKDLVSAAIDVHLSGTQPVLVEIHQDRGKMEYGGFPRRRMKDVDTFALSLSSTNAPAATP
jgi:hypothetical protein